MKARRLAALLSLASLAGCKPDAEPPRQPGVSVALAYPVLLIGQGSLDVRDSDNTLTSIPGASSLSPVERTMLDSQGRLSGVIRAEPVAGQRSIAWDMGASPRRYYVEVAERRRPTWPQVQPLVLERVRSPTSVWAGDGLPEPAPRQERREAHFSNVPRVVFSCIFLSPTTASDLVSHLKFLSLTIPGLESIMNQRLGVCCLLLMLACGSEVEAATFCAKTGNELNLALVAAEFNGQDDTIKVATGTHITDYHAPGAYQWSFEPVLGSDYDTALTISGGWNAADNCQTQLTLDPSQTVLDARYWGPVFLAAMVYDTFTGSLTISNLTFYRGESKAVLGDAAIRVVSDSGFITFDNILVTGNRSGAASGDIALFSLNNSGSLKIRNSEFLNNSFTHAFSGGLTVSATNGAIGSFTNNSISGNSATISRMGLSASGVVTLSNNAVADNTSTANPSYDFMSSSPAGLTLRNNHFETKSITGGSPSSESGTTTGNPGWTLVGYRMVPNAVSPLRDSGVNTPLGGVPNIDFSGQSRIVNVTIDRGAVEADAPVGVPTGPVVTANSPANGSTTVLNGNPGDFVYTTITFKVSGGTPGGTTKVECSIDSGPPEFGITNTGGTVPGPPLSIDAGFTLTGTQQTGVVKCVITRDNASGSTLTYTFVGAPSKASPTIATSATASVVVGNAIGDTATLTGGISPTGTVTFNVYGPGNPNCAGPPAYTVDVAVQGDATATGLVSPAQAGTYRWIASYGGDGNNSPVAGACNDANETTVVNKATPTLATQASTSVVVGNDISDVATLGSGFNPSGTITFQLFNPNNATCAGAPTATLGPVIVTGNGVYGSGNFAANLAGTWRWIASYSGDANNNPVAGACDGRNEQVLVTAPSIPTLGPLELLLLIGLTAVSGMVMRRMR